MSEELGHAIDVYNELLRSHQLNIELLNVLEQSLTYVQDFCKLHNIPFHDEKLRSSIAKAESLLNEISNGTSPSAFYKTIRRNFTEKTTRRRLPKTIRLFIKGGL